MERIMDFRRRIHGSNFAAGEGLKTMDGNDPCLVRIERIDRVFEDQRR
jgi:hypothetical protein